MNTKLILISMLTATTQSMAGEKRVIKFCEISKTCIKKMSPCFARRNDYYIDFSSVTAYKRYALEMEITKTCVFTNGSTVDYPSVKNYENNFTGKGKHNLSRMPDVLSQLPSGVWEKAQEEAQLNCTDHQEYQKMVYSNC